MSTNKYNLRLVAKAVAKMMRQLRMKGWEALGGAVLLP